jgi:hypothetical protein
MAFNVDIVCEETGEIRKEGMLLASAHIWIAKENGKIVREDIHTVDLDDIDGGGQMEVHDIFVEFPETQKKLREYGERMKKASKFWNYSAKEYVNKLLAD